VVKKFLLITSLILSGIIWAEDEFPIELTCELNAHIVFFHLDKTQNLNWWTPHPNTPPGGRFGSFFTNDSFKNKKNKNFRYYKITESMISFSLYSINGNPYFELNRYTLRMGSNMNPSGQCYKGFKKEYEKQI